MKLLVVAAWEPELLRFRELLAAEGPEARNAVVTDTVGVGVVEAAIGMTRCIARHEPAAALLIGTCGAFDTGAIAVGSVVAAARVRLSDGTTGAGSAVPGPMPMDVGLDPRLHDAVVAAGARSVHAANTLGITVDDALASRLSASGDIEHLEVFAFARACAIAGVPCGAVLGVANRVGASGRAEWLANHTSASATAADVAWRAARSLRTTTTAP